MHYNWWRYYEPRNGRYVSADPLGLGGGAALYSYAGNTPSTLTDPSGLKPGDRYRNFLCAGMAAIRYYNRLSIASDREYGGALYRHKKGGIAYGRRVIGTNGRLDADKLENAPASGPVVAYWHTHGRFGPNEKEGFSPDDKRFARYNVNKPLMVGDEHYHFYVYWDQRKTGNWTTNPIYWDDNDCKKLNCR